jgi:single-stranded-DNA-specific exonuclease
VNKKDGISGLVKKILANRGVKTAAEQEDFLNPDYEKFKHDPFLMPDMQKAVDRIVLARDRGEKVTIYGDYDIDGMTATTILWDSFCKFGIDVHTYTPDRFKEGYGLNIAAVEQIAADGTKLIITVDNGTLSFGEIARAKELGVDVIVTDHHSPHEDLPDAVAILNPKVQVAQNPDCYDEKFVLKKDCDKKLYPFADLCGAGVAFKLVQALQIEFDSSVIASKTKQSSNKTLDRHADKSARDDSVNLPFGQEKWLLDLVAFGTVCDVVGLINENRAYAKWGLEVIKKTRRPGLKAVLATAGVDLKNVDARTLGFVLGPRFNSAGRMATAEIALELLKTDDNMRALELAEKLENLNKERRKTQDEIYKNACGQILKQVQDNKKDSHVAIAVGDDWHEGVIGIVAAKILEKFERPAFVMSRGAEFAKASGRSFGDFSIASAIHATDEILVKGGGHKAAGGLTVKTERIEEWRVAVQTFYKTQNLKSQTDFLYPKPDVTIKNFAELTPELLDEIARLEPFGQANPAPVFELADVIIMSRRTMGDQNQHVKYVFADADGRKFTAVAFNAADKFTLTEFDENDEPQRVRVLVELTKNEWNGRISVEGNLIKMTASQI